MKNIYLVGFMATGKTAAGKEIAKKLKKTFVDLDELIEFKERRAIADIFSQEGQPYFRRLEKKVLKEVSAQKDLIVACGGGIVMDKDNVQVMKKTGKIFCLTAKPEIILKRSIGFTHRPLLNVPNPKKQIELLLKMRAPYYALADKTIDTSELSVKQVTGKILKVK